MKMYGGQGAGEGLTFSMLGVRVAEMKGAWLENQQELMAGLVQVEDRLGVWLDGVSGLGRRGEQVTAMHRAMSMLDIYQREKSLAAAVSASLESVTR